MQKRDEIRSVLPIACPGSIHILAPTKDGGENEGDRRTGRGVEGEAETEALVAAVADAGYDAIA